MNTTKNCIYISRSYLFMGTCVNKYVIYKCTFCLGVLFNSSSPLELYPRPVSQYVIVVRVQARVNVTLACRCLITSGLARCFSVRCVEVVSIPLHKHDPSYTECKRIHLTTSYEILHLLVLLLAVRFVVASSNWTFELYSTITMFGCLMLRWGLFDWVGNLWCCFPTQPLSSRWNDSQSQES